MHELLEHVEAERDFLIKELAHTYDKEEMFRLSGRVYELTKMKNRLQEMVDELND